MEQQAPAVTTRIRRVRGRIAEEGLLRTARGILATLASPVVRRRERLIWEVEIGAQKPSVWKAGERLLIFGPDNIDRNLTPALRLFLGDAPGEIEGVRGGDRLFVVACGEEFLACSYIFFDTTKETRRHARIYGEPRNTPIIGMSFTASAARGRGIYRRMLNDMFVYLAGMGCRRAVCEVDPRNTPSNRASEAAGMRICRQVCDWEFLKSLFVQRVIEGGRSRWRVLWA
jgi:RimJ/RimL family protein N-acetyltransferase